MRLRCPACPTAKSNLSLKSRPRNLPGPLFSDLFLMNEKSQMVTLINRVLPFNSVGFVRGRSGLCYGTSFYDQRYGAHICTMTIEEWRKCKRDVTEGSMLRWQQWEVDFPDDQEPVDSSAILLEIERSVTIEQFLQLAQECGPFVKSVIAKCLSLNILETKPALVPVLETWPAPPITEVAMLVPTSDLDGKNFRQLQKIAKDANVPNVDLCNSCAELKTSIESHRQPA